MQQPPALGQLLLPGAIGEEPRDSEMDGVSYVVPVDGRLERDVDVRYETVTLERPAGVDGGRARDWRGSLGHGDPVRRRQRPDRRRHRPERQLGDGRAQHGRSPVGRLDRLRTRPPAGHAASRQPRVPGPVSSDAKWVIGLAAIVLAILGSAFIVSNVMITLAGMVREDLHDLRESLERAACGEFARVFPGGGLAAPGADPNRRRAEETVSAPPAWPSGGNAERKPAVSVCSDR